jgi:hypothetical protein
MCVVSGRHITSIKQQHCCTFLMAKVTCYFSSVTHLQYCNGSITVTGHCYFKGTV